MPDTETYLRVLSVEDSAADAALILRELRKSGYEPASERVETAEAMRAALKDKPWDIILSDYVIPGFGGIEALKIANESGFDLPFILVSGKRGEETAVEAMKAGANDFVMKDQLGRLGSVVKRELADSAARRAVRRAEIEWHTAFDSVRDPIVFHDAWFRIVRANLAYAELAHMPVQDMIGKRYWEVFPKLDGPLPGCRAIVEGRRDCHEEEFALPTGEAYSSRAFAVLNERKEYLYSLHVLQDITERHRVREALESSERKFRSLIENSSDLVFIIDAHGSIVYVSPSIRRVGGYEVDDVLGRSIMEFTHPHDLPAAQAALSAVLQIPHDLCVAELRLRHKDGSFVVLDSIAKNALDEPALNGIVINAHDVTERKQAEQRLRTTLEGAIEALSATVEQRDPYTAGHQRRVAQLAIAIGRELELDDDRLAGLRIAGIVHDIGKICVPAEILAWPGRISPAQFEMIKPHAQVGYDIVSGIDFPWPVADAIRQHHERLDGSGYPQGLKGDQIILEARILTVADVVEAMSSHRPYRPALGIDAALKEIEDKRGRCFDPGVVDACLRLFRDKGFIFEEA
jgi:PAS domain S-box-containing protein/putative nucleotidyltransferase with HDIG domain